MKIYRITLEGRTFDVQVRSDPRGTRVEVEVNGVPLTVGVESLPPEPAAQAALAPVAAGVAAPAPIAAARVAGATAAPAASRAGNAVTAPLPGVIKRIAVQPGQRVAAGEALLVIEAMKMDNVLRAARDGVVDKVHAVEGRQVAHGAPLLEYQA